jgi:sodium/hydrogen antiporter
VRVLSSKAPQLLITPQTGPYGANIFNPRDWGGASDEITNTITLELTRVVLAIGVFAIGVELPKAYVCHSVAEIAIMFSL